MLALLALAGAACRNLGWTGEVERHGTLHEVLAGGQTQGRVRLAEVASGADVVGLGVLAGLDGEITIVDGATWVARADGAGAVRSTVGRAQDDQAAFLAVARVGEWVEVPVETSLELEQLPYWAGMPAMEWPVVPFVVRGVLGDLDAHVLHGACPQAGAVPPGKEPARRHERQAFGTLVGFWTREAPGTLTHAGQSLHAHVVLRGGE